MTTNPIILDMLGDELKAAVLGAHGRLNDETVMCRIERGLCNVEKGGEIVQAGMSDAAAIALLGSMK